jgi:8-oxo-dGTP pyrophosphatase MutT (NUDIX family)
VPHYLLICRRDTISYVEFLRGKYTMDNPTYIQTLVDGMTVEERERLRATPFFTLWGRLWNNQSTRQYRNEYEHARTQFESLRTTGDVNGKLMARYLDESLTTWDTPEWGFPKGRRGVRELPIACALREYEEETGLVARELALDAEMTLHEEVYRGTNGIMYRQLYYVGTCASDTVAIVQPDNRVMRREVGDIGWFPFETAYFLIRASNDAKRALLGRIHHIQMTRLSSAGSTGGGSASAASAAEAAASTDGKSAL